MKRLLMLSINVNKPKKRNTINIHVFKIILTCELELRANFARALALERSIKRRKKGKASLEKKNQDDQVHLTGKNVA